MKNKDYIDTVLEACTMAIVCPRGKFYPDKDYGSHIKNSLVLSNALLLAYARQAVGEMNAVYIKSAETENNKEVFTVIIGDEQRQVSIDI